MNETSRYVTFQDYLRVARERRVLIVAVVLLFTVGAYLFSSQQTPVYEAQAAIEFQSPSAQSSLVGQSIGGEQLPEVRAALAASTLVRPAVLERARRTLGSAAPSARLADVVSARPEARTNLVIVKAEGPTGSAAADRANAVARAAVGETRDDARREFARAARAQRNLLRRLERRSRFEAGTGIGSDYVIVFTEQAIARLDELARIASPAVLRSEATVPRSPAGPYTLRTTLLGLLVGLTLGLVAAFLRDSLDGRLRSVGEISDDLNLQVLGHVRETVLGSGLITGRRGRWGRRGPALSEVDLEQFRILMTNAEFLETAGPPKVLLVTSAIPGEGKSTVATALAAACAMAGKRTLIVEGDLRRPTLAGRLGVAASPGLTDYLRGQATPSEVLQTIALPASATGARAADAPELGPVVAIVAGTRVSQPAELLRSDRCRSFFEQVKETYDVVIVDTCPLLSVVDALELVPLTDALILCLRGSKTTRAEIAAALEVLSHLPARPMGVVVTGMRAGQEEARYAYAANYVTGTR